MRGFLSDWREAFVISWSYGMGDPLARSSFLGVEDHFLVASTSLLLLLWR
jgi:hypothetical protein